MPIPSKTHWKDSPITVAAIAVAATITLGIALVTQVVIPVVTAQLHNELEDCPKIKKEAESDRAKLAALEKQLSETQIELVAFKKQNLFSEGKLYPIGLDEIQLGDPLSKVDKVYSGNILTKGKDGEWSVKPPNSPFRYVSFFSTGNTRGNIYKILYVPELSDENDIKAIQYQMIHTFGQPKIYKESDFLIIDNRKTDNTFEVNVWQISAHKFLSLETALGTIVVSNSDIYKEWQ